MHPLSRRARHHGLITTKPARLCPACCRRPEFLTAADCLICGGAGVLHLGSACLRFNADVVSRAVEFAIDDAAQRSMAAGRDWAAARADVQQLLDDLLHLLARRTPTATAPHQLRADPRWVGEQGISVTPTAAATATVSAPADDPLVQVSSTVPGFAWGCWLAS